MTTHPKPAVANTAQALARFAADGTGGRRFLARQRAWLAVANEAEFRIRYEHFLEELVRAPASHFAEFEAVERRRWTQFFRRCVARYDGRTETRLAHAAASAPVAMADLFGADAGRRLDELHRLLRPGANRRLVMVGSGPLPATLLALCNQYPALRAVGLDLDPNAVVHARRLAQHSGAAQGLRFIVADGKSYDYRGADLVYIANQVTPKRAILRRIAATVRTPHHVVVREPWNHGWVLAETGTGRPPPGYAVVRTGPPSPEFLSYDVVLAWTGPTSSSSTAPRRPRHSSA